ncbi:hypothetical protein KP509_20G043600 [Ceratopteris richardii]|uniref:G-patch domain-containing protein n=1 Tax=Ceratopteris richardii TaxID=49495 RepID=A0A8T2SGN3_CERRI|nr:hypothetical protein KP509_20G043600 [Ceratopteris richardii]
MSSETDDHTSGSALDNSLSSSSSSHGILTSSNVGFRLLQKAGWKEGSGLGASEQGRLEPVDVFIKYDKRGLGAKVSTQKKVTLLSQISSETTQIKRNEGSGKKLISKKAAKKMKKMAEEEKKAQEQLLQRSLFMEFWPDNV